MATYGELYEPAMAMTDPREAARYLEELVLHHIEAWGDSREEALRIQRENLGYYAGYYPVAVQKRVEELFSAVHPVFGPLGGPLKPKTPEEAFEMGMRMGEEARRRAEER